MPKFTIIQENPRKFETQILNFWEEYLPGTPPARLEWMENNPAGPVLWFFAIEEKTGMLAGTISLFPKDLFFNGKMIKVAILGDFMLHNKFRVFGPALDLLKETLRRQQQGEFSFLYTVPNLKSKKVAERVGFSCAGELFSMMHPQQCGVLLEKHIGHLPAKILGKPASLLLNCLSWASFTGRAVVFEEIDWNDSEVDTFCRRVKGRQAGVLTGDSSLPYLEWRYKNNPEFEFQIFSCRKERGGSIQGLVIFSLEKQRLEIYDILAVEAKLIPAIIHKVSTICKKKNCRGLYISVYETNPLLPTLKRCCFFDTKDQVDIYTYPEKIPAMERWAFTSADRNI